jgi:hypothetical protein
VGRYRQEGIPATAVCAMRFIIFYLFSLNLEICFCSVALVLIVAESIRYIEHYKDSGGHGYYYTTGFRSKIEIGRLNVHKFISGV